MSTLLDDGYEEWLTAQQRALREHLTPGSTPEAFAARPGVPQLQGT